MNTEIELTKGIDPLYLARRLVLIIDGEMAVRRAEIGCVCPVQIESGFVRFQIGHGNNFWMSYNDNAPEIVTLSCRTG
jgi:hypothetical protein